MRSKLDTRPGLNRSDVVTEELTIRIPNLPTAFEGFRIAFFSDIHLYPFTPLQVVRDAVQLANSFGPDLVILPGDFVWRDLAAVFDLVPVLNQLNPAKGTFAVLGNHDHLKGAAVVAMPWPRLVFDCSSTRESQFSADTMLFTLQGSIPLGAARRPRLRHLKTGEETLTTIVAVHEPDLHSGTCSTIPSRSSAFRPQSRRSGPPAGFWSPYPSADGRNLRYGSI